MIYQYNSYDAENDVILTNFSNLTLTPQIQKTSIMEIIDISNNVGHKCYVVGCFTNTKFSPAYMEEYSTLISELLRHVRGLVRYNVNQPFTNIAIRSAAVTNRFQQSQSHIYSSKEEALAAVRLLRAANKAE